jgi:anti-sigma factor ChrR (cupin superfamily)
MSSGPDHLACRELLPLFALGALCPEETLAVEAHLVACKECTQELEALLEVTESLDAWPTDVLRPAPALWDRLSERIAAETGAPALHARRPERLEPEWEEVASGISCKLLATDTERGRVSMLVRLAPGAAYPPHTHAGVEELHLLAGELWINDRKLHPGDYSRATAHTSDTRVWSETGCTCVLVTSYRDELT